MKVVAIVQARMGSVRLPGKVMTPVLGRPVIDLLLARLARAKRVDAIGVATSLNAENDPLVEHLKAQSVAVFRGDEHDVLARFHGAAKAFGADVVIRITGDCPLLDPQLVDAVVDCFVSNGADYASNVAPPTYPDGLDVEVFSFAALDHAMREATAGAEREHVTPYLRESGKFRTASIRNEQDLSDRRWTLDTAADLEVIRAVFEHFGDEIHFTWKQALDLQAQKPEFFAANHSILRNEGQTMSSGQKLWQKAKQVVAGGNMLLSKRPDMFLPEKWPSYFSKAKGCHVWDLDGREYVDVTLMGVGTNTLGYGDEAVDRAVQDVISKGNMSTLNCPEEVWLTEKLIELHPFAEMVRFARSGGEANAVAIRIARAAAGREKVAVCGYHGWHDWYLAANLADDQLSGHLLPGLEPRGVPRELKGSIHPFNYNRFDELQAIVDQHDIGVIKMEVIRSGEPQDGFLQKVRDLATKRGIVLIFDECTSGFRQSYGGIHKLYGVEPDVAVFGKALGNGYAVTAIAGRRSVMEAAQSTFISSTFWTERIGVTAGLKTLERMAEVKSWEVITEAGHYARKGWERLASKHNLTIEISGIPALSSFSFKSGNMLAYKTLITQEMIKKGYLATNVIYTCLQHTPQLLDDYLEALDPIFGLIADCQNGCNVETLLEVPICRSGFQRLN